ncbi:ribonuclease H-like YkuK family protein [Halobacillus locisalis]|uniref:Ribonuclease H-like YkuK family protein n=1 Tax=Halobacillus locisalis TaxID=220753 RepID=A0A838CWT8_9BACI|nr:ribonuclease H-like YkuK family protein [Halobacillus locisalis]MBA2176383.1 ribonuclease H-like YkuK family protein [Halobacillus locisalis]
MRPYEFQNLSYKNMDFTQVFSHIVAFMKNEPKGEYKLMLGTDSQVHPRHTLFITGVVIQRVGKGAWACFRKEVVDRQMTTLHERISYETSLTEQVASLFTEQHKHQLIDIVLPHIYKGATFTMEGHIDIGSGERNRTRVYVNEMVARIESLGMEPKIKPDSIVASSYANRYTK